MPSGSTLHLKLGKPLSPPPFLPQPPNPVEVIMHPVSILTLFRDIDLSSRITPEDIYRDLQAKFGDEGAWQMLDPEADIPDPLPVGEGKPRPSKFCAADKQHIIDRFLLSSMYEARHLAGVAR